MVLHNRAGHNADTVLFSQGAVFFQIGFPLRAKVDEAGVLGDPISQMVFGQHGELRALRGGGGDVIRGFFVILRDLHGLEEEEELAVFGRDLGRVGVRG